MIINKKTTLGELLALSKESGMSIAVLFDTTEDIQIDIEAITVVEYQPLDEDSYLEINDREIKHYNRCSRFEI